MKRKICKLLLSVTLIGAMVIGSGSIAFAQPNCGDDERDKKKVTITVVHNFSDATVLNVGSGPIYDGKLIASETQTLTFNKGEKVKIYGNRVKPKEVPAGYENYNFQSHGSSAIFLKTYVGYVEGTVTQDETVYFSYRKTYNPIKGFIQMGAVDKDGNFVAEGEPTAVENAVDTGEFPAELPYHPAKALKCVREWESFTMSFDYDHDKYEAYDLEGTQNSEPLDLEKSEAVLGEDGVLTGLNTNNVDYLNGGVTTYTLYLVAKEEPEDPIDDPIDDPSDDPSDEPSDDPSDEPKDDPKDDPKPVSKSDAPKTGDNAQLFMWIMLLVTTTGLTATVAAYKTK